jgi:hypothetical protein
MKIKSIVLFTIIVLGVILRFYNLNWGSPFYFHPDERNIATLITSLSFPLNLDFFTKGTFSYGTLISYIVFFIKIPLSSYLPQIGFPDSFSQSIILLRFISFASSVLTIFIIFYIGQKFWNLSVGILAGLFTTFSVGLIQAAHFGTFESFLTLMYLLVFLFSLVFIKRRKLIYFFLSVLGIAVASAVKINSLIISFIPFLLLIISYRNKKISFYKTILCLIIAAISLVLFAILLSPYYITPDFRNLFIYEKNLLTGSLHVFYTGEFFNTDPVAYPLFHIFPFLINPILTIIFIPSLIYQTYRGFKTRNLQEMILLFFFFIIFLPSSFLFAKWSRYMVPALPFIYLIISISLENFLNKRLKSIRNYVAGIIIFISIIFGISYFVTAFVNQDTRIEAGLWARNNISNSSPVLSEVYDLGIVPFNSYFQNISLFNFYYLDDDLSIQHELTFALQNADYIILPSQRILKIRLLNRPHFPIGYNFYNSLLSGKLGYRKIFETPCDIFCKITYLGNPIYSFEETANVFERPTVFIFKKT